MTEKDCRILEGLAISVCVTLKTMGDEMLQTGVPKELNDARAEAAHACRKLLRLCGFYEWEQDQNAGVAER